MGLVLLKLVLPLRHHIRMQLPNMRSHRHLHLRIHLFQHSGSLYPFFLIGMKSPYDHPTRLLHSKTHEYSLEEREAAYLAARERIFSTDEGEMRESVRQKPRTDPVVARRMIVHALGQRVRMLNLDSPSQNIRSAKGLSTHHNLKEEKVCTSTGEAQQKIDCSLGESINMFQKVKARDDTATGSTQDSMPKESQNSKLSNLNEKHVPISTEHMKVENLGAAKRLFANALGLQTTKEGLHPKKETLHNSCKRL
uniref:SUZ domain-containing protein n=2 Tax=Kalanchoe fedtschenkoi TaxID=63787 RepID=A0A7N0TZH9_KALFE